MTKHKDANGHALFVGANVNVKQSGGGRGDTVYVVAELHTGNFYVDIREQLSDGRLAKPQPFPTSLLLRCGMRGNAKRSPRDQAAADQRVADIKSGKITDGPELLANMFRRR